MFDFLFDLPYNPLLQNALIACILASIVSGIIGSYVVVKRETFISGGISHTVLAGIGLFLYLQRAQGYTLFSPLIGAVLTAIIAALIIGWFHLYAKERQDAVIAALWSVGMAVGVLFISQTPGYNVELTGYLVGNILWVTKTDLWILFGLDIVVLALVFLFHKRFHAICFDETQAKLQGQPVEWLYLLLLVLTSITVVFLIQVVGIILVMTMLAIPASMANLKTSRLSLMMFLAVIISSLFCLIGLMASYSFDLPAGATIALVAGLSYAGSFLLIKPKK